MARTLLLAPALAGRALVSADLGFRRSSRSVVCRLHFEPSGYTRDVRARFVFWFARENGSIHPLASIPPGDAARLDDELARWDASERAIAGESWGACVRRVLGVGGVEVPAADPDRPVLALYVGGPGWDGVTYEPDARFLHVPSPLAPPVGDVFLLELDAEGRRPFAYRGITRVVTSRSSRAAAPGAPAEFALAIQPEADLAHSLLVASCPAPGEGHCTRTAPRYSVAGPVRVAEAGRTGEEKIEYASAEDLEQDYVRNLSHGGAFIRTERKYAVGARLELHLRLPNGQDLHAGASVVRTMPEGVGVQFALDARSDEALSAAMTAMPGRARRVLVVDDDVLSRRMLSDALAARGIDCIAAADGTAGLHALTDELLSLDAVITDIRMPGLTGYELIEVVRTAGGERDLPIVALGATVTDALRARLLAEGADAVLTKDEGPERAAAVVEEAIEARAAAAAPRATRPPGPMPPGRTAERVVQTAR